MTHSLQIPIHVLLFMMRILFSRATTTRACFSGSGNCNLPPVVNNQFGDCSLISGECKASSCQGNSIETTGNKDCNNNCADWQTATYSVGCQTYKPGCTGNKCFGFTSCTRGDCPEKYIGMFCIYNGNSANYRVCRCSTNGYVSQCPSSSCGYSYQSEVGGPTTCSSKSLCAADTLCSTGNCALSGPDSDCSCSTSSKCIGKCCPTTGKCKAASCDGNKVITPSGHERECVVNKDGTNSGGRCPWSDYSFGVKCNYLAGCSTGVKNNCWGYTACATGTCPSSAVGVFCIESGNSDNFKVCGCFGKNALGSAANCTAEAPPQYPPAVKTCRNGNCAPANPDPTCVAACAGGTCIGKCCSATGTCPAASCDGNKINNPSGHERECVVRNDRTNAGGRCPWSGQSAYGVRCAYLPACQRNKGLNCWGYTACATGTCPSSAVGVFCIESGNSDNFKVCGCAGEGYALGDGAAVAYANCTVNGTVVADDDPLCPAGYVCNTTCNVQRCPCGFYCPAGSTAAIACPNGSYCPEGSAAPVANPFVCPAGSFCPNPPNTARHYCNVTVCPCGTFCPAGSTAPRQCPAGRYCTQNASEPLGCPCGTYCLPGSCQPVGCPAGRFCLANASSATPCPAGRFCGPGVCAGTPCPCGSRCPPGTSAKQLCAPPYYCPDAGMSVQALCPIGYMCPSVGMCNATACPLGTFVSCAGKVRCDPCPVGRYCPNVTTHFICPPGSYCPVSTFQPIPCPAGSFCYIGSKTHTPCPPGFFCPAAATAQRLCPVGTFSSAPGASVCADCPGGKGPGATACAAPKRRAGEEPAAAAGPAGRTLLEAGSESAAGLGPESGPIEPIAAAIYSACTLGALFVAGSFVRRARVALTSEEPAADAPAAQ